MPHIQADMPDTHYSNSHMAAGRAPLLAIQLVIGVCLVALCMASDAGNWVSEKRKIAFRNLPRWDISAIRSGKCFAIEKEKNGQSITLHSNHKSGGGAWYLDVVSRNQRLKPDIAEAVADLSLDGSPLVTGKVLDIGSWVGDVRTATYVRFEFHPTNAQIGDMEAARMLEAHADGLDPLKLGSLSPVIAAIKKCQLQNSKPGFWE